MDNLQSHYLNGKPKLFMIGIPQMSNDDKLSFAKENINQVIILLPNYGDFILTSILDKIPKEIRKNFIECQWQIEKVLGQMGIVENGTFSRQLRITKGGEGIVKSIKAISQTKPSEKRNGSFNDQMNKAITILSEESYSIHIASFEHAMTEIFVNVAFIKILTELKRLNLVDVINNESYLLKHPINEAIKSLPREFENKPYEYFLDEEKRSQEFEASKKWYETANAKKQYEDYPKTENRAKWGIRLAVLTLLLTIVLEIIKWKCNRTG